MRHRRPGSGPAGRAAAQGRTFIQSRHAGQPAHTVCNGAKGGTHNKQGRVITAITAAAATQSTEQLEIAV